MLVGYDFGLITMVVGAAVGRRDAAFGTGAVPGRCFVSAQRPRFDNLRYPAATIPVALCWSVGNDHVSSGVSIGDFTALIVAGLSAYLLWSVAFRQADLNW
jgi:hypothetical protein